MIGEPKIGADVAHALRLDFAAAPRFLGFLENVCRHLDDMLGVVHAKSRNLRQFKGIDPRNVFETVVPKGKERVDQGLIFNPV